MTAALPRLLRALDRFHATHPWDHNAHYHRWILRRLPGRSARALDVGSGSGDLARLLATRAEEVHGIDADPTIVDRARERTVPGVPVTFFVGDALEDVPSGLYDVITCVATVHHMPLTDALTRFREHLAPGGTLIVVGLYRPRSRSDYLIDAVAIPSNIAMAWIKNKGRRAPRPVAMTAPTRPATTPFPDIVRDARLVLPGARLRRRLFWRYTLVWNR
ncbi:MULTISPECIES: class I SAM-dependent methyltransferase [Streptomyces]|uniref:class I SAM-dependent methyltransferase n=1 Tax=Streptomyces TaxID=1883 RepID=UPI000241B604|nr:MULTISPECIES: class I SAM-dependent methyltransferase [Streptomyces]EHM26129.1 putative methyltransferase [Streptomyces sp. W007]MCX4520988.1 class I SAM-dependent methyltransferase [Streptomyces anulatus]MCX4603858.1 class I SAM-dependent methyltransferase [Streptomyces anulatus]WTD12460.1 class I SAM-dependent methyltransferase [Streptomyces anulatus]WTD25503.1 class I SAM-dependent methyltransferase [Streptomyces anulatus]